MIHRFTPIYLIISRVLVKTISTIDTYQIVTIITGLTNLLPLLIRLASRVFLTTIASSSFNLKSCKMIYTEIIKTD